MDEYPPKEVFAGVYSRGRRLCEFSVRLRNVPGAIASISEMIAGMGVNILSGFHDAKPGEDVALWSFIVDLTGLSVGAGGDFGENEGVSECLGCKPC
jgi:hypothetical protein